MRNSLIVCGLAALFYWSFMFAKHDPALRNVIPFGVDPYDAVGSFAVVIGGVVALISVIRAFRPPSPYLVRAQLAVVLFVFVTLASDAIAMARHPAMWIHASSRTELLALLGGLAIVSAAVYRMLPTPAVDRVALKRATFVSSVAAVVLAIYPEQLINSVGTHLLSVVVGAIILFAPVRPLLAALVPCECRPAARRVRLRWSAVVLAGILFGAFAFIGEMSEGGAPKPDLRLLLVASVFVGLAIAGVIVAYAFLGKPLGLSSPNTSARAASTADRIS